MAATITGRPDRFDGFATVPTTAPGEAATELERCICNLGLKTAAHLGVPRTFIRKTPGRAVREAYYLGFGPEVDLAFATFGLG